MEAEGSGEGPLVLKRFVEKPDAENAARNSSGGKVAVLFKPIGDRPAGATPDNAALVRIAVAAAQANGLGAQLGAQSTDANVPMSLGIPAIAIGSGMG